MGSTAVSALIDTIIFSMIAFYGIIPFNSLIWFVLTGYFIKLSVETLMLPLTIKVVNAVKKIEGQEHFDKDLSVKTIFRG